MIGRTLSHFRITAKLGEGGMGEVYRAEDVDLGREVAIKALPRAMADDPDRLARFEREARVLASLNHPNIGAVYEVGRATVSGSGSAPDGSVDVETQGGSAAGAAGEIVNFLVMELIEGEDLEERLRRGPLSPLEVHTIAVQIARALDAAHQKGIVHRDLKPANVMLKPGGEVKVLDFGLAKAMHPTAEGHAMSHSPTLTAMTGTGLLLGTAAYMSPEQARGLEVDKRTDVWSFGCVLYEMLCSRPVFHGDTVSDVLARILERPVDLDPLPSETPRSLRRLLARCLEKDPNRRLRDIGDALWDLTAGQEEAEETPSETSAARHSWPTKLAIFAAGLLLGGGLLWMAGSRPTSEPGTVYRFDLQIPPSDPYSVLQNCALAITPDGGTLAYVGLPFDQTAFSELYIRHLDSFQATAVPDTLGAYAPFFSPDGAWIGYFDSVAMWKKPIRGGPAVELAPVAGMARGGSWTTDDRIFFAPSWYSPIFVMPATGGVPEPVTTLLEDEKSHRFPSPIPDGSALIFTVSRAETETFDDASVAMQSLASGERRTLVDGATDGRFLPPDRLLYGREGSLYVSRLDVDRMELVGLPAPAMDDVITSPTFGSVQATVSSSGTLAYLAGSPALFNSRVVEVSRSGQLTDLPLELRPFTMAEPSPDGRQMAMRIDGANGQIWIYDLERGTLSKITQRWDADFPAWHPDGESLSYVLSKGQSSELARVRADGTGEPEILWTGHNITYMDWAPDGRSLVFTDQSPSTGGDLWRLDLDGEPRATSYLRTPADERDAEISPDGKWLAYSSDESGRSEIYVQAYPVPDRRYQISVEGGRSASWSPADGELLFKNGEEILTVPVELGDRLEAGIPRRLFTLPNLARGDDTRSFSVSRVGRYFAVLPPADWEPPGRLRLVLGWAGTLE